MLCELRVRLVRLGTISLSTGAKRLAEGKVVVKRLVSIDDLGNIVVLCMLFTDKTGTLTMGHITFAAVLDADRSDCLRVGRSRRARPTSGTWLMTSELRLVD